MDLKNKRHKAKETFAKLFEMPNDVILDLPKITMIGGIQLYIENHRGVIEFSGEKIRVAVAIGELEILGRNLEIRGIFTEEIIIEGNLDSIKLVK
ncbi:sporulation protein YqfC [Desulfitispora alkaliphila]|uniref:sporulation protein YqfC n=1 Tax=Desulfitispora alkaliphila TaxID=622674 RepID=UPI003D22C70A